MDIVSKIKNEIEQRITTLERNIGYGIGVDAQINAYNSLLSYIDSIQKEILLVRHFRK